MNDEWQREREQTTKRMLRLCVSMHDSHLLALLLQSFTPSDPIIFACFSVHPIKPYHWPRACQLHACLLLIKHTNTAATTLPPELLTHAFFFFFLPLFLTHTHTQMLSHTLSLSLRHTHMNIYSLFLSVTSSYF